MTVSFDFYDNEKEISKHGILNKEYNFEIYSKI